MESLQNSLGEKENSEEIDISSDEGYDEEWKINSK